MGEHVGHEARHPAPLCAREARRFGERRARVEVVRPGAGRHFGHAAEQALRRARAYQHVVIGAQHHEGGAAPQFPLALFRLARKHLGVAARPRRAVLGPRTQRAGRLLRGAERGAEIHHRLGEVARAPRRRELGGELPDLRLRAGQFVLDREQPRHDALDVAVDRRRARVERDRRDRGRRVGPDARQRGERRLGLGELPAVALRHIFGARVQMARPRVVAEPGPRLENVVERRARERLDARKAREEARVVGRDRLHGGLLQHDLGEPHPVGISALAGRRAPRQPAAVAVVPREQLGGWRWSRDRALSSYRLPC